ncbi:GNAT family N-acetyltransferase [Nisaea sp.]|uniref:GNAT family N-acetyltransferase n=1 Tax=Nisaea sp. TaxID=2024842 RepID=UPI003B52F738
MLNQRPDLDLAPVGEDDAHEIMLLLNRIIDARTYTSMTETMSVADQRRFIATLPDRAIYLAARDGRSGRILGVQDCLPAPEDKEQCDISTFVSLDAFRRGIGRALFERTADDARQLGYRRIRAVMRTDNTHALNYYGAMGFRTALSRNGKTEAILELPA